MPELLPDNIIADTLNAKRRRENRQHRDDDKIPRLHVSSLIKSGPQDFFCEREFVLLYAEGREKYGGGLPPKFELLYEVGHFYGNYIVNRFLERNPEWGQWAWGDWKCPCGHTHVRREHLPAGYTCEKCKMPVDIYVEVDLLNPAGTVVGHADLIFAVPHDGVLYFYIYEFKSIDRADVDFNMMTEPLGDHVMQASNYYWMLRGEGKKVSKRLRFVYVDRSMAGLYTQLPFKEFQAKVVASDRLSRVYDRARRCHRAIEKKVLPERKCKNITCSRAVECKVAVSCFERKLKTFRITR